MATDKEDAERYRHLRDNFIKIQSACRDGPAHPYLSFYWDIWAEAKLTWDAAGLDAAVDASIKQLKAKNDE